jgi:DNA polymerase-3 subunit alpha
MAAVLSADMDKTDKVVHIIDECRAMNLKILPPDVNVCDYLFTVDENQSYTIRYGLGALKGIGEAAVENILTERKQRGPFIDLFDFCRRIDLRKANRRVLEALVSAGGLDKLGPNRATLMASIDSALKVAEKHSTDRATGQNDIFAMSPSKRAVNRPPEEPKPFIKVANDWSLTEKLQGEKDVLGIYLSGHPINQYLPELAQLSLVPLAKMRTTEYKQTLRVGGWVIDCRSTYAKGKRMAFFTVEDDKGRLEVKVPPELYEQKQSLLTKDTLLIVEGEVREDDYNEGYTMTANQIVTLDQARDNQARRLEMTVAANLSQSGLAQRLIDILTPYRQAGRCRVLIYYQHPDALVELLLGENWRVQPHQALIQQLQEILGGEEKVKVVY